MILLEREVGNKKSASAQGAKTLFQRGLAISARVRINDGIINATSAFCQENSRHQLPNCEHDVLAELKKVPGNWHYCYCLPMAVQHPEKSQSSEAQGGVIQGKISSRRIEGTKASIWIKKQLALLRAGSYK